jgi:hypothetical protein
MGVYKKAYERTRLCCGVVRSAPPGAGLTGGHRRRAGPVLAAPQADKADFNKAKLCIAPAPARDGVCPGGDVPKLHDFHRLA